ncbi:MAG: helix-turn-helix transcriptional regulator [Ruminococcaceae bacterium]|nr:helix-turn-helix transcriptional regulator [Oscillospiraceae bacterium]
MLKNVKSFYIRYQILWRLGVTAFIFLCLPMTLVNWYTVQSSYQTIESRNRTEHLNLVTDFQGFFNSQLTDMHACSVDLSVYKRVTPNMLASNQYSSEAITQMDNYCNTVPMAANCFLYFYGSDYIASTEYTHQTKHFYHFLSTRQSDFSQTMDALFAGEKIKFIPIAYPKNPVTNGMLVFISTSVLQREDSFMLFHVNESSLTESFFGHGTDEDSELYILDRDGQVLFPDCTNPNTALTDAQVTDFIRDPSLDTLELTFNDVEYCLFRRYDPALELSFVELIPRDSLFENVSPLYKSMKLLTFMSTLFILCMLVLVIYINYKPISKLCRQLFPNRSAHPPVSETEEIMQFIDRTTDEKHMMEELMVDRTRHLSQHILSGFLAGKNLAQHDAAILGIDSSHRMFCCFSLESAFPDTDGYDDLSEQLRQHFQCSTFINQNLYDRCVTFLCAYPVFDPEIAVQTAEYIRNTIEELLSDNHFRLGTSEPAKDLSGVKNCYLSSLIAMEQGEQGRVCFYEESLRDFSTLDCYPSEEVLRFVHLVNQGDFHSASEALSEITAHIEKNIPSIMFERYVCYDVINVLIKSLNKNSIRIPSAETAMLMNFNSLADFKDQLLKVTRTVCEEIGGRKADFEKNLMEAVRAFVEERLFDPDLGRTMIADEFKLSNSATSELVNNLFQCGLREYIVTQRVERSKAMLLSSEKSVNDIAVEVGFRDPSYYIRVFKKIVGSTPHAFRKANITTE